jgi:hypothetical protein
MNETKILPIALSQIRDRKEQKTLRTKYKYSDFNEGWRHFACSLEYSTLSLQTVQTVPSTSRFGNLDPLGLL